LDPIITLLTMLRSGVPKPAIAPDKTPVHIRRLRPYKPPSPKRRSPPRRRRAPTPLIWSASWSWSGSRWTCFGPGGRRITAGASLATVWPLALAAT